jgi:CRP/FNR family transcriptional regulator, anaerobic regulatory protein
MQSHANTSLKICSACPMRNFGLCPALIKIMSEQLDAHFPRRFTLPVNSYLYRQGGLHHCNYIVKEGWLMLSRISKEGTRQVLRSVLPGDFLGFQPDLKGPYIDSAIALSDSVICVVPDLLKICHTHPELALRLAWIGACDMTLAEIYLSSVVHKSARERIIFLALELYLRLKHRGLNRGFTIQFPLLQEDIADTLGLTRIHVNRTLKALAKEGLLKIENHELTILDYDAMCDMVGSQLEPMATCDFA